MNKIAEPQLGMRFAMQGAKFEVSFVSDGLIRYSSSAGGQVHRISYGRFLDLQADGIIVLDESALLLITAHSSQALIRKHRYVDEAIRTLPRPTAKALLAEVIKHVATKISDPTPPAVRSVARWIRDFNLSKEQGLAPRRRSGNRTIRFSVEVEQLISEAIESHFLRREWGGGDAVHSHIIGRAAELGLCDSRVSTTRLPSIRTIQRRLKKLDRHMVVYAQQGPLAASKVARAAGKSVNAKQCLSIVQMDTHKLDILVVDPDSGEVLGRPFLTVILDVYTRCIVGIYVSMYDPSATTALAALKDMLVRYGIPSLIIPDNGVEFANSAFILVCGTLKITISPAQSRDPNGKAHIESFFRTLTNALIQGLPGTTFSNPTARGDYDSTRNARFTMHQVRSFTEEWINEIYHKTVHTRTRRAPIMVWREQTKVIGPIKLSAAEVDVLARRPHQRTIQNGRVQYEGLYYYSHALPSLESSKSSKVTILIDELNLHTVFFENPSLKGEYLMAESTDPEYTNGLTLYEHIEAMKIKKEFSESDKKNFGRNTNSIAKSKLLERIQKESNVAKKWRRKLTNGSGQKHKHVEPGSNDALQTQWNNISQSEVSAPPSISQIPTCSPAASPSTWQSLPIVSSLDVE
jgi:putative transposase